MSRDPRTSVLRAPLVIVAFFVLALLALYPAATLRAQAAPASTAGMRGTTGIVTVPRPDTLDGELSDMAVKGKSLEVRFRNTGTREATLLGEVQVRALDDSLLVAVPLVEQRRVAAGREEVFRIPMPSLRPGKYVLYAVIDFGGRELTAAQAALEIRR